ncbi:alpha/beta hydrolase [Amycolatopsis endophytica]|uniref:Pimeloyl-ACP methyl ester carboxylesterase n=1 Tax=Amycolatopsis endophytica TaxID=860233 RepID=A0A853BF51_9PSEU|nr:alpha/beta fold hydrolase [Amycolatopsis endophytica]NYI93395.1 pimeloyl-ACP methyl ester carboxylesterase [Amycolatopsis endophytica]
MSVSSDHAAELAPRLNWLRRGDPSARTVVLMLPGGRARSHQRVHRHQLAYLRVAALGRAVARSAPEVPFLQLQYRFRGWNDGEADPLADAHWAMRKLAAERPGTSVVVIGHSMGGRVGLRLGDQVSGVCALAPWIVPGEPVCRAPGRAVIAHGTSDRWTDPRASHAYARRAGIPWYPVERSGHTMLRRSRTWRSLVTTFLATALT